MKNKLIVISFIVLQTACGKAPTAPSPTTGGTPTVPSGNVSASTTGGNANTPATSSDSTAAIKTLQVHDKAGNMIGDATSIGPNSFSIYLPGQDLYVSWIAINNGQPNGSLYYSEPNCTGKAWSGGYVGPIGKGTVYDTVNKVWFLAEVLETNFNQTIASVSYNGICVAEPMILSGASGQNAYSSLAILTKINQPYDFQANAPYTFSFSN